MKLSENGIYLIKRFEGFSAEPYICPAGKVTIGYGHIVSDREKYTYPIICESEALDILLDDVCKFESAINRICHIHLNQNQFDALVSLCFNVGISAVKKSKMLAKLNGGDYVGAANEFDDWIHSDGRVLQGLIKRRAAEKALFLVDYNL